MSLQGEPTTLAALPAELRAKIYNYVFSSSTARLRCDRERHPSRSHKSLPLLLSLQLVNTRSLQDSTLYDAFLKNSTFVVSDKTELKKFASGLTKAHLNQIRHVCIRPMRSLTPCSSNVPESQNQLCPDHNREAGQGWQELDVAGLVSVFPNLRTLSVKQSGVHINTFHHDLSYTLAELIAASKAQDSKKPTPSSASEAESDTDSDMDVDPMPTPQPSTSKSNRDPYFPMTYDPYNLAQDFSHALATCVKRTAPRYGRRWYLGLLRDAVARQIEVLFDLELMFLTEAGSCGVGVDSEWWEIIEDVQVSTKDWVLRLNCDGEEFAFPQEPVRWLAHGAV